MKTSLQGTYLTILFIAVIAAGCKKGSEAPIPVPEPVINPILTELTSTSVVVGGRITSSNYISEEGVCFSATNTKPTVSDIFVTDTVGQRWDCKLTGLAPNTTYYVRAYAIGDGGTGYSEVTTFKTNASSAVPKGTVTTFAGSPTGNSGYAEGTGTAALFDAPNSIAFNAATGLLYVGDSFNNALRVITTGGITSTLGNRTVGLTNGAIAQAQFYGPKGFSFDVLGNTYVADLGNNVIRKITAAGQVSTLAGNAIAGYINGEGIKAEFYNPTATITDAAGNVYVADRSNNLIRKITPAGVVSVFSGYVAPTGYAQTNLPGFADATGTDAYFNYPVALTKDAADNIYVADYKNQAIRKITPAGVVTTYAGGTYFPKLLGNPTGVVMDAQGNLFISENSGRILEITKDKVLYVLAGVSSSQGGYVNGVGAAARFNNPQSLTIDAQGNLYVADFNNNAIRKITIAIQ
jgi:sugar lactone lactonase YvrE